MTAWLSTCDCYVDALFGVGLKRPVEGDFLAAVRWMNGRRAPVVSCDLPSGVDGDTGEVLGEAVRALEADSVITDALGAHVTEQYLAGKRRECRSYAAQVSQWELEQYLVAY